MRVTFDSNVWQMVVTPRLAGKTNLYDAFTTVHEALRTKDIRGFICETVGTLEAVRLSGRKAYFSSIKPVVEVNADAQGGQVLFTINVGTNHSQHPGLPNVLKERLELAFQRADLLAHGGLGDVVDLRGLGKTLGFDQITKNLKTLNLHKLS